MSMIPKGGETIWGGLDWSPEGAFNCSVKRTKNNNGSPGPIGKINADDAKGVNYGRIISFGKDVADMHSSKIERMDFRVTSAISFLNSSILNDSWALEQHAIFMLYIFRLQTKVRTWQIQHTVMYGLNTMTWGLKA